MLITPSYFIPSSYFFLGIAWLVRTKVRCTLAIEHIGWDKRNSWKPVRKNRNSLCRKSHLGVIFRGPSERKKKSIGPKNRWKARKARPLSRETSFTFIPSRESEQFHAMRSFCARCIVIVDALAETNDHANHPQNDGPLSSISIVFHSD